MRHAETLLIALVFAACHVISPWVFQLQQRQRALISSFAGGLAAAYVCLHLIPEIDQGSHHLGGRVYFLMLIGLAVLYGVEIFIERGERGRVASSKRLVLHASLAAVYSFLLVLTLSEQLPDSIALTLVFALAMGVHLISTDLALQEQYPEEFVRRGRFGLVAAVLAGYAASLLGTPNEQLVDSLTALMAGFMMFNVFREEVPDFKEVHFRAFLLGIGLFLLAHVLLSGVGESGAT